MVLRTTCSVSTLRSLVVGMPRLRVLLERSCTRKVTRVSSSTFTTISRATLCLVLPCSMLKLEGEDGHIARITGWFQLSIVCACRLILLLCWVLNTDFYIVDWIDAGSSFLGLVLRISIGLGIVVSQTSEDTVQRKPGQYRQSMYLPIAKNSRSTSVVPSIYLHYRVTSQHL